MQKRIIFALVLVLVWTGLGICASPGALSTSTYKAGDTVTIEGTIEPGQGRDVELVFEKPDAPAAVLMLLGFSFEIGGLE